MTLIAFPTGIVPQTANWRLERFDRRFDGLAGTFQTATIPGARWRCTLSFPLMKREDAGPLQAFLARVSDLGNRFELPDYSASLRGTGGGSPAPYVLGADQTGRSIMTGGWNPSEVVLKAGDMIQVGTNQLHIVTADVTSSPGGFLFDENGNIVYDEASPQAPIEVDGVGRASIPIEPALQWSPTNNAEVIMGTSAKAVFMLDGGYSAQHEPGIFTGISVECVQDLSYTG